MQKHNSKNINISSRNFSYTNKIQILYTNKIKLKNICSGF